MYRSKGSKLLFDKPLGSDELRKTQAAMFLTPSPDEAPGEDASDAVKIVSALQQVLWRITDASEKVKLASQIYHAISKEIVNSTHYDAASICCYEGDRVGFHVLGYHGLPEAWEEEVKGKGMRLYSKEWADAVKEGRGPVTYYDLDRDPVSQINMIARSNTGGIAICPIDLGKHNWGIVTFHLNRPHRWSPAELDWVTVMGKHVESVVRTSIRLEVAKQSLVIQNESMRQDLKRQLHAVIEEAIPRQTEEQARRQTLSERERDVLALIALGHSNQEISAELFISESTVKKHVNSIFRKLEVKNRTQAAKHAKKLLAVMDEGF